MRLEQRADELDVGGIADHDRMRVADVDDGDLEPGDALARDDLRLAEVGLVEIALAPDLHRARPDANARKVGAGSLHEPGAGDARPVSRHLRVRAVGIHDRDLDLVAVDAQDLDGAVELAVELVVALSDLVDVPVCVPAR